MNIFKSKAIYSWKVRSILQGDPQAFATLLSEAGFQAVFLKVADGDDISLAWKGGPENVSVPVVEALRGRGLSVVGWGFVNAEDAVGQGRVAAEQVNRFGLDGYIFDAESAFDAQSGAVAKVDVIFDNYRQRCDKPSGLAWWARWKNPVSGGTWHPRAVGARWMERCDYGLPMCYWEGAYKPEATPAEKAAAYRAILANALRLLEETVRQWRELTDRPIVPTGRAYIGDGGMPTPEAIAAFERRARELGCPGVNWWGLDWAAKDTAWWRALKDLSAFPLVADETVVLGGWGQPEEEEEEGGGVVEVEEMEKPPVEIPYVSQLGEGANLSNKDCGFASSAMLIRGYTDNKDVTPDQLRLVAKIVGDPYIHVKYLKQVLNFYGVGNQWFTYVSLSRLTDALEGGKPAIVLIKYSVLRDARLTQKRDFSGPHFAVAVDRDDANIYIHDPYWDYPGGARVEIPIPTFERAWNEVGSDPAVPNPRRALLLPRLAPGDPLPAGAIYRVATDELNVRSEPDSTRQNIVETLIQDTHVTVVDKRDGWARSTWPVDGWLSLRFLEEQP